MRKCRGMCSCTHKREQRTLVTCALISQPISLLLSWFYFARSLCYAKEPSTDLCNLARDPSCHSDTPAEESASGNNRPTKAVNQSTNWTAVSPAMLQYRACGRVSWHGCDRYCAVWSIPAEKHPTDLPRRGCRIQTIAK